MLKKSFGLIFVVLMFVACGGNNKDKDSTPTQDTDPTPVEQSTIAGRVTSVDGAALANVSIQLLSGGDSLADLNSGADGNFTVELDAGNDVVMQLIKEGYADQVVPARSPDADGNVFLDITMIARGALQSLNIDAGATRGGDDGASVTVDPASFVDANGATVTGSIDVTITPVDTSNPASLAAFPGSFSGVLEGDTSDTPIISLGTVEFEFSQNGQPLQLGPGQTADVVIPIYSTTYPDGTDIMIGETIPLWSLNQSTGIWLQEGTGTVVASATSPAGLAMAATVSHFSWWNCDVSMNAGLAVVTVFGPDSGTALIKARTGANIGWRPDTVETIAAVGVATEPLFVPSNGVVCFWAEIDFDNGSNGTTPEVCVTPAPSATVNVDLVAPTTGPISIMTSPPASDDVLEVVGNPDYPSRRVQLQPTTYETAVSYIILPGGSLPAGISLNAVTATGAEIAGIPTELGSFSAVIQATDSDGFTDTVTINFTVSTDVIAPELSEDILVLYTVPEIKDLNEYNSGGPVDNWALTENVGTENGPPPVELILNAATGALNISEECIFWRGDVTATNSSASVTAMISIEDNNCF